MLRIDTVLTNQELMDVFKCGNAGGMRRSKKTNSLVLIFDHTKHLYDDEWKGDTLHYTGMGLEGDQRLDFRQNKTLAESRTNGVKVLFESNKYRYVGEVYLADEPYQEKQKDKNGLLRNVWFFPLKRK